ncbi:hypothetical protein BTM25_41520 [Actinomadura rubteroloni]|uniref:Uncharacterized protein n=1 Tax=Actinomadura rubteroloni TaxID=1926885 RepID=A0A2P4UKB6_9ACTN|nr:hypothetical protein [Actinomadura rubteroloni]POM25504.1 hypothetical protein BTM25_41520 [Actinomadura rubteroloni]
MSDPTTPSGLPVRVPQANLAPTLRTEDTSPGAPPDDEPDDTSRPPEEVQRIMGAYQRGTRRGRSAAAGRTSERSTEGEDE